jgi:gamma-glutamyl:cysteine ligase YbdK (ATP-grasp superfamily)
MNQTVVCLHVFVKRRMQRPCSGCARGVEFAAIPHIIAKSTNYPSVMGTATGCTTSRKNITKPKRRNRQTK